MVNETLLIKESTNLKDQRPEKVNKEAKWDELEQMKENQVNPSQATTNKKVVPGHH